MGLVMSPGQAAGQLDIMNEGLNSSAQRIRKLLSCMAELEETKDILKGESYDSIRDYYQTMHIPVLRGFLMLIEDTIQESYQYKVCIGNHLSGLGYVDEDALKEELENVRNQIDCIRGLLSRKNPPSSAWGLLEVMEKTERLIEKKLEQINDFLGASAGCYGGLEAQKAGIQRGIECLHEAIFDGKRIDYRTNNINLSWIAELDRKWIEREIKEKELYIEAMKEHFGFDDETSRILYDLYYRMQQSGVEDLNRKYFAMLASYIYSDSVNKDIKNTVWHEIAGTYDEDALNEILERYGLTEEERTHLKSSIRDNYGLSCISVREENDYYLKSDLAHMSVISATILKNNSKILEFAGGAAGWYCSGIFNLEENAGYIGDVYGTAGNGAKLTQDDYKADLDAVNFCNRLAYNDNCIRVIGQYYSGISSGEINRASEFIVNLGGGDYKTGVEYLETQMQKANTHALYHGIGPDIGIKSTIQVITGGGISLLKDIYEERGKIQRNFYKSLMNSSNEYMEIEPVDIEIAEMGGYILHKKSPEEIVIETGVLLRGVNVEQEKTD